LGAVVAELGAVVAVVAVEPGAVVAVEPGEVVVVDGAWVTSFKCWRL
jgi:cation transport ATPase